ncbi:MAG TPA: bifunctional demethylmenaquinone methyltransferase/2-methoxy-6-polyprenyl-1,4-benzoquinol methylase UbiE [Opitutaceae bacterium]|nr:bifunctional demethylmenaquinone methyltransferase/2-methoxy-6-polyprenyl-1,4-benzoquinol methylase UbiE [Opitutaceae bacterium]
MPDPAAINAMFGRVARRYDLANRVLSGGVDRWWRRRLVAAVRRTAPRSVLDLATGSGDVAFALSRGLGPDVAITGADFCEPMLEQARAKQRADGARYAAINFVQGDGLALPFPDETFGAVTISFGLRNMADRARALAEMRRVLRRGGHLYVLEFSQPDRWLRPLYYWYLEKLSPKLAGLLTGEPSAYEYLCDSIEQFPDRAALAAELTKAGFGAVTARGLTFGIVALHEAAK